jgi:hypothetical protein
MTFNVRRQSPAAEKSAALGIAIQSDIARQTRVVRKFQHSRFTPCMASYCFRGSYHAPG